MCMYVRVCVFELVFLCTVYDHKNIHPLSVCPPLLFIRGSGCIIEGLAAASQIFHLLALQPTSISTVCFGFLSQHIGSEAETLVILLYIEVELLTLGCTFRLFKSASDGLCRNCSHYNIHAASQMEKKGLWVLQWGSQRPLMAFYLKLAIAIRIWSLWESGNKL